MVRYLTEDTTRQLTRIRQNRVSRFVPHTLSSWQSFLFVRSTLDILQFGNHRFITDYHASENSNKNEREFKREYLNISLSTCLFTLTTFIF